MGMIREISTLDADGVDLTDILSYSHQSGHRAERLSKIVRIETGDNHPDSAVCESLTHIDQFIIEELGFVDTYHIYVGRDFQHMLRIADRSRLDAVKVVGDDLDIRVPDIDGGLEDGDLQISELGPLEPADKFFRLSGKHRAANHLDAARSFVVFRKHL